MLIHGALQEQLIRDRQRELEGFSRSSPISGDAEPFFVGMVRALLPALAHRTLRIPAPARPAGSGC